MHQPPSNAVSLGPIFLSMTPPTAMEAPCPMAPKANTQEHSVYVKLDAEP